MPIGAIGPDYDRMMKIRVNGEEMSLDQPCSVSNLIGRCRLDHAPCAVEVNTQLVPKREHDQHLLSDGDTVEIVTLVGGG